MHLSKVIITKQISTNKEFSFENEVGLSTYDLSLISTNKIINQSNSSISAKSNKTYLI